VRTCRPNLQSGRPGFYSTTLHRYDTELLSQSKYERSGSGKIVKSFTICMEGFIPLEKRIPY
jgi:hypothetical protein